jgi:hypothetical protein
MEEESCSPLRIPRYAQLLPNLERKVRLWCNPRLPCPKIHVILIERTNQRHSLWHADLRSLRCITYRSLPRLPSHHHREQRSKRTTSLPTCQFSTRCCPRESTQLSHLCAIESIEIGKSNLPECYCPQAPTKPTLPPLHRR